MLKNILKIATRKSPLALWQATYVKNCLKKIYPKLNIKLIPVVTQGDILLNHLVFKIGGKGIFVKELEQLIIKHKADLAVHSIKDLPANLPEGLGLVTICKRENPYDVIVSYSYRSIEDLPKGAVIGTSSMRRGSQIISYRPDLLIHPIRGNIGTRINRLHIGTYDAIIIAAAGLNRLGIQYKTNQIISANILLPAVGQGAIGIECRLDDNNLINLLEALHDEDTAVCIKAERAMNKHLKGGCALPIASFGVLEGDNIWLRGLIGNPDGSIIIKNEIRGPRYKYKEIGILLAEKLLSSGGKKILNTLHKNN
ncbi:hydroxymethylbilane synthase [Candidatus Pantoea edessiphila]|uniref:Porphobilinogen deaminase n=1 Tax=Candidatus Pantoea edessiphila TaxID=2044610 RepID=A0A2P5SXC9_9GAMM|nr:hydroxymethylbilane synthase [Candidatus Pantoea edessiphila]MBK4775825.1 hydroxymethylbilane synthase [Pantoea sp. Edef]PPI86985.1 hydroxymethylbilane synthase [Candidatus Pantoea edessiphila]